MNHIRRAISISLVAIALGIGSGAASVSTPAEQMKETIEHVRMVLNESPNGSATEQRESIRTLLSPRFDFSEMAKMSLGAHWKRVPERQVEFVAIFTDFVEYAYVGRILSLREEKIVFVSESVDRELAQVETKIIQSKGAPLAVDYRLHLVEGTWKVYDVVIENISLVSNYRSQFHRIITSESFDELLARLKAKSSRNGG
jgi:phospholipid transport system substrate-binding protein